MRVAYYVIICQVHRMEILIENEPHYVSGLFFRFQQLFNSNYFFNSIALGLSAYVLLLNSDKVGNLVNEERRALLSSSGCLERRAEIA